MRVSILLLAALFAVAAGAAHPAAAGAAVRLYVFDCGSLRFDDVSSFGLTNEETDVRELFVPCYLIEHRGETVQRLLFDAGLPPGLAGHGEQEPEPGMHTRYDRTLEDQLAALDLTPADIDYVAFSHLHFDHTGSANLFTGSELLIQAEEYQAGFIERREDIYPPQQFLGLADSPRRVLEGDYDVFGDDSVRLIRAPGHTPGHQALLIRLADTGPIVLSGDLYHFRKSRELRRTPVFNTSREETLASMDKVEALLEREGATLWIEHDRALADTLRKAPEYYK